MAAKTPKVWSFTERATLEFWVEDPRRGERLEDIHLDSEQWFQWLNLPSSKSFNFKPVDQRTSDFIASKETKNDGDFWYACKKINGELCQCYIGLSQDLTLARLREIGLQFLQTAENNCPSTIQSYIQEVHLNCPGESQEVHQLKQEVQKLQDELAKSRLELEKNKSASSQQKAPKKVYITKPVESQELKQLKQEIQKLQDELANSHQTYRIAGQEHQEKIQQMRHQNQRLQTECDQMKEEIKQLYARYGDLKLEKLTRQQDSERVKSRTTSPEQRVRLSNTAYSF
ncbi:hypothetical protein [Coleofasciculus sp. FACHB-1120]|uniref:hypothetical protein n=1 Tax=Coleofasciculus sp. FACHB-1120 TaxID=2692783 RepID=UPI001688247D|nr:hypothetical protein [Coleofasciculus sp. FACHB-1120]MBD2740415.1 hypothetical protein [Coleofasciculus sp. FACHB-1120]